MTLPSDPLILKRITHRERSTDMPSQSKPKHDLAAGWRKPAWLLVLALVMGGCSGQSPAQSTASSSLVATATPSPAAPATCGDFLALTSDERDQLFPATEAGAEQYTDQGVTVKVPQAIYAELCPGEQTTAPLSGLVYKWAQMAPPSCGKFVTLSPEVREKWVAYVHLLVMDITPADITPADWVQACNENQTRLLTDMVGYVIEIVQARDAATDPSTSAKASTTAPATSASGGAVATWVDSDGRQVRVSWSFTSAIKGSDPSNLLSSWTRVGGSGSVACFSNPAGSIDSWQIIPAKTTRVWVGTLTVENLTPTFGWPNMLWINSSLKSGSGMSYGYQMGNSKPCVIQATPITWSSITGDTIRVPFVLVEHNAYTPNNPNGSSSNALDYQIDGMGSGNSHSVTVPLTV